MGLTVHVAVGARPLLGPDAVPGDALAAAIGPHVAPVPAEWAAPIPGQQTHDFLRSAEGPAVAIMGRALVRDYGALDEPLLIFSHLLAGYGDEWGEVLSGIARAMQDHGADPVFVLHGVALTDPPELTGLLAWMQDLGLAASIGEAVRPEPGSVLDIALRRNLVLDRMVALFPDAARSLGLCWREEADPWAPLLDWLAATPGFDIDHQASDDGLRALAREFVISRLGRGAT